MGRSCPAGTFAWSIDHTGQPRILTKMFARRHVVVSCHDREVILARDKDILLAGRGKHLDHQPGNVRLTQLVERFNAAYHLGSKTDKDDIVCKILKILKNEDRRFLLLVPSQRDLDIWYWVQDTSPCGKVRQKIRDAYKISVNKHFAAARARASSLNSPGRLFSSCFDIRSNNFYSNHNHGAPSFVPCPVVTMPYPTSPQRDNTVNAAQLQSPNYQVQSPNGSRLASLAGSKQLDEQDTKAVTFQHSLPESSHRGLHLLLEAASSKTLLQNFHTPEASSPDSGPPTPSQSILVLERACGFNGAVAAGGGTMLPTSAFKEQGDVIVEQPAKIPVRIDHHEKTLAHIVNDPRTLFHDAPTQGTDNGLLSVSNDERNKSPGPALTCEATTVAQQSSLCGGHPKDSTQVTIHILSLDDANTQTIDDLLQQDAAILMHHEDDSQTLIDSISVHSIFKEWTEK